MNDPMPTQITQIFSHHAFPSSKKIVLYVVALNLLFADKHSSSINLKLIKEGVLVFRIL